MYINTQVVRALMALRRIDEPTLANIANVSAPVLSQWLYAETDESEELIAFDTQLEILRVLGINGETPRNDIVHYWYVHEELFSSSVKNYWALALLADAFGKADAVYFAKEADPAISVRSKAHFGLQFPSFKAVLEVTSHPLRNIGFDPARIANIQWAPGNFGVLVAQSDFRKLAPGLMTPGLFDSQLNVGREMLAWERLNLLARDQNIGADQIEMLLLTVREGLKTPKLTTEKRAEPMVHNTEHVKLEEMPAEAPRPPAAALKATVRTAAPSTSLAQVLKTATVEQDNAPLESVTANADVAPADAQPRRPQARVRHSALGGSRRPWPAANGPATNRD